MAGKVALGDCTSGPSQSLRERLLVADTVEKLRFEISGDFICDLSVILYSRYEGVVEVR